MVEDLEVVYKKLKRLEIQGATAVAKATVKALGSYSQKEKDLTEIRKAANYLLSARPTEPMAQNGIRFLFNSLEKVSSVKQKETIFQRSQEFARILKKGQKNLYEAGGILFPSAKVIFTHCHSSSVEGILKRGKEKGFDFRVTNTETRPLYQGRKTARNLLKAGIPVRMLVDSAGPFFLSSFFSEKIDFLLMGGDAVLANGSAVNKIGSYGLSLAASQAGIPVYLAVSFLKYFPHPEIELEQRDPKEVWSSAPKDLEIVNLAFDHIPTDQITGFITEGGIIKPEDFSREAIKTYPWLANVSVF
jgi:ribose 1,5-bisphosphate isomerase